MTNLQQCLYGYGYGKASEGRAGLTCLIPYRVRKCRRSNILLGDDLCLRLVGAQLPSGEIHDGYLVVSDYAKENLGAGPDSFSFFKVTDNEVSSSNPLIELGLSNPSTTYQYAKSL